MASTNVRQRGKIRHEEWPKITQRFRNGETLAEIARSYRCTAPAIRYIIGRVSGDVVRRSVGSNNSAVLGAEPDGRSMAARARDDQRDTMSKFVEVVETNSAGIGIWSRINNDIATFLASMDALFATDSDGNYEALLKATDRLLWASARTRLELERVISGRKAAAPHRRVSG